MWPASTLTNNFEAGLLPLPLLPEFEAGQGASKIARRRRRRRGDRRLQVNSVIEALNALYGGGPPRSVVLNAAQVEAHRHLLRTVQIIPCSDFLDRPQEAMRLLLGTSSFGYELGESSTVKPYCEEKLSLPAQLSPVGLEVLPAPVKEGRAGIS